MRGAEGTSPVQESPTTQHLRFSSQDAVRSVSNVNVADLARLAEMDIHVQGMLPSGHVFIRVRQVHVLLATIGRHQDTLPGAHHPEMCVVSGGGHRAGE